MSRLSKSGVISSAFPSTSSNVVTVTQLSCPSELFRKNCGFAVVESVDVGFVAFVVIDLRHDFGGTIGGDTMPAGEIGDGMDGAGEAGKYERWK